MKLLEAIRADDPDAVRSALKKVKDINRDVPGGGWPPIMLAARVGRAKVIPLLLELRADPHHKTLPGASALAMAAEMGRVEAVRVLLERVKWSPEELYWASMHAGQRGHVAVLELLRDAKAPLHVAMQWSVRGGALDVVRWCLANGVSADVELVNQNVEGSYTPLHVAARSNSAAAAKLLIDAGADVNFRDGAGRTPLMIAAKEEPDAIFENRRMRKMRQDRPEIKSVVPDDVGFTVFDALLDAGADATLTDRDGSDAMKVFLSAWQRVIEAEDEPNEAEVWREKAQIVRHMHERLKKAGATGGNAATNDLLKSAQAGDADAIRDALDRGADINGRTTGGNNALALAADGGQVEAIKALLAAGADINDGGRRFRPLVGAAHSGHLQAVKLLVQSGADVNLPNPNSTDNALYVAKVNRKSHVVKYLMSVGARYPETAIQPFTPGVEFPGTYVEAFVKAPGREVADAVAATINGAATHDVWGKTIAKAGKHSFAIIRLDGSDWTSVMGLAGTDRIIDKAWQDLIKALSKSCNTQAILICHEDVSGHSGYELYDSGKTVETFVQGDRELYDEARARGVEVPASVGSGTFTSRRGKKVPAPQRQDGCATVAELAQSEWFRAVIYSPGMGEIGEEFDFEILRFPYRVAEASYVSR